MACTTTRLVRCSPDLSPSEEYPVGPARRRRLRSHSDALAPMRAWNRIGCRSTVWCGHWPFLNSVPVGDDEEVPVRPALPNHPAMSGPSGDRDQRHIACLSRIRTDSWLTERVPIYRPLRMCEGTSTVPTRADRKNASPCLPGAETTSHGEARYEFRLPVHLLGAKIRTLTRCSARYIHSAWERIRSVEANDRWCGAMAVVLGLSIIVPLAAGVRVPGREDFGFHTSLIESNYRSWQALGRPSPFLSSLHGSDSFGLLPTVYGGTSYALIALLRFIFSPKATLLIAVGGAYAGISWGAYRVARAAGAGAFQALCLAAIAIFNSQMISTIYPRMAIAEILAFGSAMLLIGALVTLYVKGTARLGCVPIALFAAAMFFGGHPLTLLWGGALGVVMAGVILAVLRPKLRVRERWWIVLPVILGALTTAWQWPMAKAVYSSVVTPDPRSYLFFRAFYEPLGHGSGPNLWNTINPLRPSLGGDFTAFQTSIPALLVIPTIYLLWHGRSTPRQGRRTVTAATLIFMGLVLIEVPAHPRLVAIVWPIATMQYHWRLYSYCVVLLFAAVMVSLDGLRRSTKSIATRLLLLIALFEVALGVVQINRSEPISARSVDFGEAPSLLKLIPNAAIRNDAKLRSSAFPVDDRGYPTAAVISQNTDNPEAPLVLRAPGADRFIAPVLSVPPFVKLSPGFRPVGWAPAPLRGPKSQRDATDLWLVIEGPGLGAATLIVSPASQGIVPPTMLAARVCLYGLGLLLVGTTVAAGIDGRRSRRRAPRLVTG